MPKVREEKLGGETLGNKGIEKLPHMLGNLENHTQVQGRMHAQRRP